MLDRHREFKQLLLSLLCHCTIGIDGSRTLYDGCTAEFMGEGHRDMLTAVLVGLILDISVRKVNLTEKQGGVRSREIVVVKPARS